MANTTFQGPVRSEGGFEQITKNGTTGAITTNLDVDASGNITTTGTIAGLTPYESITDATKAVVATDTGKLFGLNRAGGIVVTLPTPAAGLNFTFAVETTFTGTGQIKTATTDGTDGFVGHAVLSDPTTAGDTNTFVPAASNDVVDLGSDEQGRLAGGVVKFTGVNTTTYLVEAVLIGDGTLATPFTDS